MESMKYKIDTNTEITKLHLKWSRLILFLGFPHMITTQIFQEAQFSPLSVLIMTSLNLLKWK